MHDPIPTLRAMPSRDEERGKLLRALREQAGWSQEYVAHLISEHRDDGKRVTSKTVWNWEGGSGIQPDNIRALAKLYNVPVADLQGNVEIPSPARLQDYIEENLGPFHDWIVETTRRLDEQDAERVRFNSEVLEALERNAQAIEGLRTYLEGLSLVRLAEQVATQDVAAGQTAPREARGGAGQRRRAG